MKRTTHKQLPYPSPSKRRQYALWAAILCCMIPAKPHAQELTTQGTQFWAALMANWLVTDVDEYYITASAPRNCTVTVSNPQSGWSHTLTVAANSLTTYQLPSDQCWQSAQYAVTNKGLRIDATDTVQIWIFNQSGTPSSCDATQILPTTSLGTEYIVQSTPVDHCTTQLESRSQFSVLATEDSTVVDITLSSPTATGIASGTTFTITLQAGQVFQVQGPQTSGDFSGTLIKARACKKIAVFSGASTTSMPDQGGPSADHTYQQNIPLEALCTEWLLTPSAWHDTSDYVRITSPSDNCQIYCNGTLLSTIHSGATYQFKLTTASRVTTSQPAALYQYLDSRHASNTGGDWGDVAMFAPNSAHQMSRFCTFPTYPLNNRPNYSGKYYVNIVVPTSETSLLLLDGSTLNDFHPIGGTAYSYSRHPINQSLHTITTTGTGFSAYAYGLAENWEAYAMSLGGTDTSIHLNLSGTLALPIDTGSCTGQLWWGDTLLVAPSTTTLFIPSGGQGCDSLLTIRLTTYPSYFSTVDTALCHDTVIWGDTLLAVPGTHTLNYSTTKGCDSTLRLNLSSLPSYKLFDTVYIGANDTYRGPDGQDHLVGEAFEDTLLTHMGCDSIIHITVMPIIDSSCQHHLWVPNTFTPLLDGNNRFRVISDNVTQMEVSIFQRWGVWVCTFDGLTQDWDGTKNGAPCPEGTYVYLIRYTCPCQTNVKPIVGTVTILH